MTMKRLALIVMLVAPAALTRSYGTGNGFGWKLNETIGAQILSIPMALPLKLARDAYVTSLIILVLIFARPASAAQDPVLPGTAGTSAPSQPSAATVSDSAPRMLASFRRTFSGKNTMSAFPSSRAIASSRVPRARSRR